ncbi:carbohydrate ABC transporter permease [Anaerocolumna sp. MB42-C2]|uniref:carbohydrate ABC transporter permease n=1 Tax=Anaerocolumna sp. MB42-C2 TaxID=3070997 RepID=UPI0027E15496|nr:sugar ABC transporter permease [Anaerocolumna sp. MB42-C2]WMJ89779.1 sugar ABC transporter permease [Anaerocolumna sp. MB42-C2]
MLSKTQSKADKLSKSNHQRNVFIAWCTIPTVVLFCIFMVYPTINVFYMSLFQMSNLSLDKKFVGLKNFSTLLQDDKFWQVFRNSLFFIIVVTAITITIALFFAAILNQCKLKEKPFYQTVFFFPNVLSLVVISTLFIQIYDPTKGILSATLKLLFGTGNHAWLGESGSARWCIVAAMVWQAVGYYMVMYIAGMDGIPKDIYEVADLEGMSKFKQFFVITIPLLWEIIRVTIVFFIISTINMSFVFVKVMTPTGGPDGGTEVFLTYMYKQAFTNSNFGYAMTVGTFIFLFSFALALVSNRLTEKETIEY